MTRRQQRIGALLLLAAASMAGPGCISLNPKPIAVTPECAAACEEVPCPCRGKVYVFMMAGLDPLDFDRVWDVRTALIHSGFTKVYTGQFYHERFFAEEMRRISRQEPDAQLVVVGFSTGADFAASLVELVGRDGIPITLLASVDPYWWSSAPTRRPANVQQTMLVHGEPLLFGGRGGAGMDVQIPETFPANITAHPLTVENLARTLASIAGGLPRPQLASSPPVIDATPTPRPVAERGDAPRDAWDFLRPVASLRGLTPSEPVVAAPPSERTTLRPTQP
jgi:hypothetical protein